LNGRQQSTSSALSDVSFAMSRTQQTALLRHHPRLAELSGWLLEMPGLRTPLVVMPDLTLDEWGLPTGLILASRVPDGPILPTALSDAGCGFRLARLRFQDGPLTGRQVFRLVELVQRHLGPESECRADRVRHVDMQHVFGRGAPALTDQQIAAGHELRAIENRGTAGTAELGTLPGLPKMIEWARQDFGRSHGHFFTIRQVDQIYGQSPALRAADIEVGDYVVIIHSGGMLVRECIKRELWSAMARWSVDKGFTTNMSALGRGVFGLPMSSPPAAVYRNALRALQNFAFASRLMAQQLLAEALHELDMGVSLSTISDFSHSGPMEIELDGSRWLFHRRGAHRLVAQEGPDGSDDGPRIAALCTAKELPCYLVTAGSGHPDACGFANHGVPAGLGDLDPGLAEDGRFRTTAAECDAQLDRCYLDTPPVIDRKTRHRLLRNSLHVLSSATELGLLRPAARLMPLINLEQDPR
jgi:hypothetical protein